MRKKHKISALLSTIALLSVAVGIGENSKLPSFIKPTAITAQASDYVWSGSYGSKFSHMVEEDVFLYFSYADSAKSSAVIVGSGIGKENVSITIPDTVCFQDKEYKVTAIADGAFENQTNLSYVYGCRNIESIGNKAFSGCTELTYFSISAFDKSGENKLKTIGDESFLGCTNLITNICPSVENNTIGVRAFSGCTKLNSIYLYNTSYIGAGAYEYCNNTREINIQNTSITEIYENTFSDCNLAENIHLPDTLVSIGDNAFYRCNIFKEIYIPDSVVSIGENAFKSCRSVEMVMMSENIEEIADHAFYGCDMMRYFVCKNPNTKFGIEAIGYDHNRFYTGKKNDFTIWGKGGTIKEYADSLGFTYLDCNKAPSIVKEKVKDHVWKATNTGTNWSQNDGTYYYNDFHKPYVYTYKYDDKWEGSCAGLAAASMLTYNDIIEFDDFCVNYPTINSIPFGKVPDFTKSFVNTLWANQQRRYNNIFHSNSSVNKRALRKIEYYTYAQKSAVISYHRVESTDIQSGHAIICFGLEFKEDASDKDTNPLWNNKDVRFLISDNNYSTVNDTYHLYINTETGEWGKVPKNKSEFRYSNVNCPDASFDLDVDYIDVSKYLMENPTKITEEPSDASVNMGEELKVTIKAVGDGLTYKWYYKDAGMTSFLHTKTFTGDTYTTTMTAARDGRKIYCVVSDEYGNSLRSKTVTISSKVNITKQPVSVSAAIDKTAKVKVEATGKDLTYKWYYKNADMSSFLYTKTFSGDTYTTTMNDTRAGRQIYCVITDTYGNSVQSDTVTLNKISTLSITQQPSDVFVKVGEEFNVTVKTEGEGLTYEWYYKNKTDSKFYYTKTFTGDTYTTTMNDARDGRQIYCVITDTYGNSVQSETVTLNKIVA